VANLGVVSLNELGHQWLAKQASSLMDAVSYPLSGLGYLGGKALDVAAMPFDLTGKYVLGIQRADDTYDPVKVPTARQLDSDGIELVNPVLRAGARLSKGVVDAGRAGARFLADGPGGLYQENPPVIGSLLGAGLGAALSYYATKKHNKRRRLNRQRDPQMDALTGGVLGAGLGAAIGMLTRRQAIYEPLETLTKSSAFTKQAEPTILTDSRNRRYQLHPKALSDPRFQERLQQVDADIEVDPFYVSKRLLPAVGIADAALHNPLTRLRPDQIQGPAARDILSSLALNEELSKSNPALTEALRGGAKMDETINTTKGPKQRFELPKNAPAPPQKDMTVLDYLADGRHQPPANRPGFFGRLRDDIKGIFSGSAGVAPSDEVMTIRTKETSNKNNSNKPSAPKLKETKLTQSNLSTLMGKEMESNPKFQGRAYHRLGGMQYWLPKTMLGGALVRLPFYAGVPAVEAVLARTGQTAQQIRQQRMDQLIRDMEAARLITPTGKKQ
jgi:hypothetical protein